MRSAPSRELPPNLKATTLRHLLPSPPLPSASPGCAAGRRSASSSTFSWFMAYAPGFHSRVRRLELAEGSKTRNPPPGSLPAVGWKLFLSCLLFFPSPEAVIVFFIVVVEVVDLDDLEVIRFLAMDIITNQSLPCLFPQGKVFFVFFAALYS